MAATRQASGDVIGPYRLEEYLGGGAFGSVWRAIETASGVPVAIKLLGATDSLEARSEIELLAATASSTSEHVVRVLGGGLQPVPYIAMEYVEGSDLAESLTERGRLPIPEVIQIGLALADAFVALERVGIVHRDVKPGNVLLANTGQIKLADFGIAKIAGFATVTSTRQAPMTMAYAAPEVWEGHASKASDFYAFGCVLYQCLVGRPPFEGGVGELYKAHAERVPETGALPTNTPASLRNLILKCLAKKPEDRPTTADEVLTAMRRAEVEQADITNAVVTSSEPRKFGPWLRHEADTGRPWTWHCTHETTGEPAIVEIHGFGSPDGGEVLDRAYEHNAELVAFGAERILGRNRLLLRPGEAWLTEPPGEFLFWVARERVAITEQPPLTREDVWRATTNLHTLTETSSAAGIPIEVSARTLARTNEGVRVLRPGLPPVQPVSSDAEVLAWLLQGHTAEVWPEAFAATSLAALASAVTPAPAGQALAADDSTMPDGLTPSVFQTATRPLELGHEAHVTAPVLDPPTHAPDTKTETPPVNSPNRRRPGVASFALFGVAVVGLVLAGAAFMFKPDSGTPPSPTPVSTVEPLEIKSVDCTPTTVEVGAPVTCEVALTGASDGAAFTWDADGGQPSEGSEVKFTTTFASEGTRKRVVLKVCEPAGRCLEKSAFVTVNPAGVTAPEAAFTCAPNPVRSGEAVSCAALGTGAGLSWTWDAPGGSTAAGSEQSFSTSFKGTRTNEVTLTICRVDDAGKQACATAKQTVLLLEDPTPVQTTATARASGGGTGSNPTPTPIPPPVIASVLCTPPSPKLNDQVTCSASITGTVDRRTWLASGGSPASGTTSTFATTYSSPGPKTILLEVCNVSGCATQSGSVSVSDLPAPQVELTCVPGVLTIGAPITCMTRVANGTVTSWTWNAPSGSPASGNTDSFVATYNTYGNKSISVAACNGTACSTITATFRVDPPWATPANEPAGPAPTNPPEQPTSTPTALATPTSIPNATPTQVPTGTPTPIPGATNTPTATMPPTATATPTASPTPPPLTGNVITVASFSPSGGETTLWDGITCTIGCSNQWVTGHQVPLTITLPQPTKLVRILIWDRPQSSPDNNQINTLKLTVGSRQAIFDMNSQGFRCIDVTISGTEITDTIVAQPWDASGQNGFSEIEIWASSKTSGPTCSNFKLMP